MGQPIITLTTDFGLKDSYVAEMKGVILSICSHATIIDISHEVEKFNVRMGAYVLASAAPYFPKHAIHVAVVDPGVGTRRRALCIETKHGLYLGPDNGVLALAVRNHETKLVYAIANREFVLPKVSDTFHGRDLFSPAAAHLARGRSPSDVGPELRKMLIPKFAEVVRKKKRLFGEVIHVDDFGNVVTNIREKEVRWMRPGRLLKLRIKNTRIIAPFCKTYGQVEVQKPLGLIGSHGFLEVSINQGHAAEKFRVKTGDNVTLYRS